MTASPIRFYFDFISPYAYVAWTQVHALADRFGREVEAVPILFAALLDANGNKGPAEIPSKRVYIWKDVLRTARVLGVPLTPPPGHPFNPLLGLRIVSSLDSATDRNRATDVLFAAAWGGGHGERHGITEPLLVGEMLSSAGFDGAALVALASTEAGKARVRDQTTEALARGVFGVPTLLVDGELFWGVDSLGHAERRLRGEDPIEGLDLAQWADLPAQAKRKNA